MSIMKDLSLFHSSIFIYLYFVWILFVMSSQYRTAETPGLSAVLKLRHRVISCFESLTAKVKCRVFTIPRCHEYSSTLGCHISIVPLISTCLISVCLLQCVGRACVRGKLNSLLLFEHDSLFNILFTSTFWRYLHLLFSYIFGVLFQIILKIYKK